MNGPSPSLLPRSAVNRQWLASGAANWHNSINQIEAPFLMTGVNKMSDFEKALIGAGFAVVIYCLFNIGKLIERQISEQQETRAILKSAFEAIKKLKS